MTTRTDKRMQALGCILSDGLTYPWFDVLELDDEAVTATVRVEVNTDEWVTKSVTADDVARGLHMYREWLEGKREGHRGEWKYAAEDAVRAKVIDTVDAFDPAIHARADKGSYGWETVKFDRANGDDGDYDANTADAVMQFALIGHCIYG